MARDGRIWKFTNKDDKNDVHYVASFNAKNYIVKNQFDKTNPGKNWIAEVVETVKAKDLGELRSAIPKHQRTQPEPQPQPQPQPEEETANLDIPLHVANAVLNFQNEDGKINQNSAKSYIYMAKRYLSWVAIGYHDYLFFDMLKLNKYALQIAVNKQQETLFWSMVSIFNRVISTEQLNQIKMQKKEARSHFIAKRIDEIKETAKVPDAAGETATQQFNSMKQKRDSITDKSSYNYMLASWYVLTPPKRPSTLASVTIKPVDEEHNFLDLKTGILHMNVSKTIKSSGPNRQQMPTALVDVVKSYLSANPQITDYIFNTNVNSLTQQVRRIFGMGNNDIRHTFVTYATYQKMDMREVMRLMDSSELTAMLSYNNANKSKK